MNHGQLFCNLAFVALSREETELAALACKHPLGWRMSVSCIEELAVAYVLMKAAASEVWHQGRELAPEGLERC